MSFLRKMLPTGLLILMITCANARVFWNKFDVINNNNNTVLLSWNVTEYNNQSFIVQHSTNGTDWKDIAIIESKKSAETMTDYSFKHDNKLSGKQFYRLKDIDVDTRSIGTSPIKTLVLENKAQAVTIWPNPATSDLHIVNDDNNVYTNVKVFNLSGKMMIEKKLEANSSDISVSGLPAGIYILKLENNKGHMFTEKITKQ